jgi:molecular chaperone HtpG
MSAMQKGKIDVTTENIFPIIKKFLYSEHEIFLRELISNAIDTQKLKNAASWRLWRTRGPYYTGFFIKRKNACRKRSRKSMTEEEITKYINQIAFRAEEFLAKYQNQRRLIGHFDRSILLQVSDS